MKKITTLSVSALVSAMLLVTGCSTNNGNQETSSQSVSVTEKSPANEKVGYSLGYMMAEGNKEAVGDLNLDTFEKGFRDGYEGTDSALTQEQMQEVLMTYQKEQEEKFVKDMESKATDNKAAGEAFLVANAKKEGVKETASGLQYKVIAPGTGKSPKATDVVEVNYEGKLIDGTVFDSSYERGEPIEFPLNQVIAGWTEGLQLMKEGGKYEFYIPSDIAYGEAGNSGIEPNSTLIFTVELLKVK
ncbi:MAG: FKBP-type peptidyl-prolyl cis-trans isomerase [Psychrobacter glaciei]|jgi:FKBP-type peptidyl-prolyl cis-trans isomerase|uniref:Peptidyl-prolyl cis-trans isomerase n=1 Tax=Psychrobacter glaciei TaxID=619771 RepID=A0ABQ3GV23_9GAMM|nr:MULTISPECIES: FKBP-type peptidyl-prolyl cis-trans isomerase [Psychrobacter]MBF4490490.1 FKBP-type peptidyl-prolyl cis-trans isomerase [Psychrobacter sp. N25K4-3-2]MCH1783594.1 FKBP-type peptidyl-prolyl cis-trans isomerase [Psychrobacter glaciei]GHD38316.1 peptidyl-prolyl cis-trans isomerase [Psychrobacter glaciei]